VRILYQRNTIFFVSRSTFGCAISIKIYRNVNEKKKTTKNLLTQNTSWTNCKKQNNK